MRKILANLSVNILFILHGHLFAYFVHGQFYYRIKQFDISADESLTIILLMTHTRVSVLKLFLVYTSWYIKKYTF